MEAEECFKLILGDCLEQLKPMTANSVDAVVTDPPWALKFMNKKWDYALPSKEIWLEVIRVLKPGGHALICCGTRTQHRMVVNIEDAGFDIRDVVSHIYGSGFPKSHNIGDGWGTALKPACEFWTLARKPLSESTVAKNVLKHGTGALNIDGSRIEAADQSVLDAAVKRMTGNAANDGEFQNSNTIKPNSAQGRWPANVLFECTCTDVKDPNCPQELLDQQSGILKQGVAGNKSRPFGDGEIFGTAKEFKPNNSTTYACDQPSGASRFFYCAKASKSERNKGLEFVAPTKSQGARPNSADSTGKFPDHDHRERGGNNHPTVKPIKLMEYLCKLITPPGGVILDPFMGSGSTLVAAARLGFRGIGIEMNEEYLAIAQKRIEHAGKEPA